MNMKKRVISAAILAAAGVGNANAVYLSTDNTGQAFVVPYYSVTEGHETYISILNTTGAHKAIKVRFREAHNTRDVLDFNLYLSPYDVWVAKVDSHPEHGAVLVPFDTSCTVPRIYDNTTTQTSTLDGVDFVRRARLLDPDVNREMGMAMFGPFDFLEDHRFPGETISDNHIDYGMGWKWADFKTQHEAHAADPSIATLPDALKRLQEGYLEVIEMGEMDPVNVWRFNASGQPIGGTVETADSKHIYTTDPEGVPRNCAGLEMAWSSVGIWRQDANYGITPPRGGLMVEAQVIETTLGAEFPVPVTALEEFRSTALHTNPGSTAPNLGDAFPEISRVPLADGANSRMAVVVDQWAQGWDAVSAVLMAQNIQTHYSINPNNNSNTALVVNFPTKSYYADLIEPPLEGSTVAPAVRVTTAASPFTNIFDATNSCDTVTISYANREERQPGIADAAGMPEISPPIRGGVAPGWNLCHEMNVVNFGIQGGAAPANELYSRVARDFLVENDNYRTGWASLSFLNKPQAGTVGDVIGEGTLLHEGHHMVNPLSGNVYRGLPVLGFRVHKKRAGDRSYAVSAPVLYNRVIKDSMSLDGTGAVVYTDLSPLDPTVTMPLTAITTGEVVAEIATYPWDLALSSN